MQEKRRYPRFQKQYTIIFSLKNNPQKTYDMSRLLDVSRDGLKFFSYEQHYLGTSMLFQIKFPFLYPDVTTIEGEVVGIEPVLVGKTYKIRIKFINVDPKTAIMLDQMEKMNLKNPPK